MCNYEEQKEETNIHESMKILCEKNEPKLIKVKRVHSKQPVSRQFCLYHKRIRKIRTEKQHANKIEIKPKY